MHRRDRAPVLVPLLVVAALVIASPRPVSAQGATGEPDVSNVSMRLGPLYHKPFIGLTNLGVDTNVFNEPVDANPKRDFTFTLEPRTDLYLRMGRTWITGLIGEQVVWYQKYSTERSSNTRLQLGLLVPLNRLGVRANGAWLSTRERPGFEIDARAPRHERALELAAEFQLLSRTYIGVRAAISRTEFDQDVFFLGRNLETELNRTTRAQGVTVRNQLTPLTSLNLELTQSDDAFQFSPLRDSKTRALTGGVKFDQSALLKGGAQFGYRSFTPLVSGVPDFKGFTTAVDLTYVLQGSTRLTITANRDVAYSFDVNQPYYLQTGFNASIAQQIFGPVDVAGHYGYSEMAYRDRTDVVVINKDRVDHVVSYGIGTGYHVGESLRIGVNVDQSKRESVIENRRYEGLKFGTSVTYGM